VVGYRIPADSKPNVYVRTEGHIPTRLESGSWYAGVPDEVVEAFLDVGLLVDEPPFPVGARPPAPRPSASRPPASAGARPAPRPRTPRAPAARPVKGPTSRVCPGCRMQKAIGQFVPDSDLCVDCR
jgi:hypothetical protein